LWQLINNKKMKILVLTVIIICSVFTSYPQDLTKFKLYKPEENAKEGIKDAVKEAEKTGRQVLLQVGGNWCIWCARFNDFITKDASLDSLVNSNYVVYHLNYSPENKNSYLLAEYDFPQRFGFPVLLVLNEKGDLIHTQSSWYLESGKSYDKEKVVAFFKDWSKKSFDPAQYKEE
jgi:thioredoxin-related protein